MRCSVVLFRVALVSCVSLGRAQLQIDESAFFDAFKAKHLAAWSEGSAGGAGIAVILEEILGAKLDTRSEKDCNVAFEAIAGRWRGGDMPPAIFAQMLRNSKPELQRVLSATRTSMAGGVIPPAAEHTGAAAEAATAAPGGLAGQLSGQPAAGGLAGKLSAQPQMAAKLTSDAGAPSDTENIKIITPKPGKDAAAVEAAALAVAEAAAAKADMAAAEAELAAAESELVRAELDAMRTSALRKRAVTAGVTPEKIDLADDAEDTKAVLVQLVLAQEGRTTQKAHPPPPPPPPPPLPPPPPYVPPPPTQREQLIEQRRKLAEAEEANAPTDPDKAWEAFEKIFLSLAVGPSGAPVRPISYPTWARAPITVS
jgi:hypothetical protein